MKEGSVVQSLLHLSPFMGLFNQETEKEYERKKRPDSENQKVSL
jgi:hypothetical protein